MLQKNLLLFYFDRHNVTDEKNICVLFQTSGLLQEADRFESRFKHQVLFCVSSVCHFNFI